MYSHQPPQIAFLSLSKAIYFSQKDFKVHGYSYKAETNSMVMTPYF